MTSAVLGFDPGVERWNAVALGLDGAILNHGSCVKGGDSRQALGDLIRGLEVVMVVIEEPTWEGSLRSRRYWAPLNRMAARLAAHVVALSPVDRRWDRRAATRSLILAELGVAVSGRDAKTLDYHVRGFLLGLGYSTHRGGPLGNVDQRDAAMAALYGVKIITGSVPRCLESAESEVRSPESESDHRDTENTEVKDG